MDKLIVLFYSWGIDTLRFHIKKYNKYSEDLKHFYRSLLQYLLTHSYFLLDRKYYHERYCLLLDAKLAPTCASFSMGWWEEYHFFEDRNPYRSPIHLFYQYLDNLIFFLCGWCSGSFGMGSLFEPEVVQFVIHL